MTTILSTFQFKTWKNNHQKNSQMKYCTPSVPDKYQINLDVKLSSRAHQYNLQIINKKISCHQKSYYLPKLVTWEDPHYSLYQINDQKISNSKTGNITIIILGNKKQNAQQMVSRDTPYHLYAEHKRQITILDLLQQKRHCLWEHIQDRQHKIEAKPYIKAELKTIWGGIQYLG